MLHKPREDRVPKAAGQETWRGVSPPVRGAHSGTDRRRIYCLRTVLPVSLLAFNQGVLHLQALLGALPGSQMPCGPDAGAESRQLEYKQLYSLCPRSQFLPHLCPPAYSSSLGAGLEPSPVFQSDAPHGSPGASKGGLHGALCWFSSGAPQLLMLSWGFPLAVFYSM